MPRYSYPTNNTLAGLIQDQGRIRAQQALAHGQSGMIWANALSNVGQIAGQAIEKHAERKEQEGRSKLLMGWLSSGRIDDPSIPVLALGPEKGMSFAKSAQDMQKMGTGALKGAEAVKALGGIARNYRLLSQEQQMKQWPFVAGVVTEATGMQVPPEYDPDTVEDYLSRAELLDKHETVTVGGRLLDKDTQEVLYEPPPEVKAPASPTVGSFEDYVIKKYGPEPTPAQIQAARGEYAASVRDDTPRGLTETAEGNIINRLVSQWDKAIKPAADLQRQVTLMEAGMEAARRGDLNAGAQAVLVTFQKILDPTSVVRESEYARSPQGLGLIHRIQGAVEKITKGGPGVPPQELEKFYKLAHEAVAKLTKGDEGMAGYTQAIKDRIGKTADRFRIPRDLIFEDFSFGAPPRVETPPGTVSVGEYTLEEVP